MARKIFGWISIALSATAFLVFFIEKDTTALPPAIIFIIVGFICLLIKGKSKQEKKQIRAQKEDALEQQNRTLGCKHTVGLPLAEGTACTIVFEDEEISINAGGHDFKLPYGRITDLQIKTDVEIQKAYTSSIGGAVGGAVFFGPLGAMIGGRAKEKTSKILEHYFVVTYTKDDQIEYLSFWTDEQVKAAVIIDKKRSLLTGQRATVQL